MQSILGCNQAAHALGAASRLHTSAARQSCVQMDLGCALVQGTRRDWLTGGEEARGGGKATGLGEGCVGDCGGGELCIGGLRLGLGCAAVLRIGASWHAGVA